MEEINISGGNTDRCVGGYTSKRFFLTDKRISGGAGKSKDK